MYDMLKLIHPSFAEALPILTNVLSSFGLPRSCSKILATLYLSEKPLSGKELTQITGYSKSAVSATMKMLEARKIITVYKQGKNRIYAPNLTFSQLFIESHITILEKAKSLMKDLRYRKGNSISSKLEKMEKEISIILNLLKGDKDE
ncbi:MAG: MarR family transcriptional regulator [Thermofilaceae archaeon]|nr:MarR family transcriptional regulator [Thermofilaceae archaeon]MCX8180391.1 MarR family transcriptional regulator [Thermofilaceae archaeon]MDW8003926.1 MarR family transcriptional regulator [Thermofilaceae archaeon]